MTKEDITTFAPVSIPTLCRYEHFKRCIESLSCCTWAEYTDVYVALDYPAKKSHWEGYRKIKAYLESCGNMTFKSLNVVMREKNYGFGPNGNHSTLIKELWKKYDRRIGSEDDNEFSPNFLVYMNKMLERFKDDDRVCYVCGYNREVALPDYYRNNYYITRSYNAWGVGLWRDKRIPEKYSSTEYLKSLLINKDSYRLLLERGPSYTEGLMSMLKSERLAGDMKIALYETLEYKYNICPTVSKVRNHGNDGTGAHSLKFDSTFNSFFENQPIDDAKDFELGNDIFVMRPEGIQIPELPTSLADVKYWVKRMILRFDIFLLRHFNLVLHSKYI